LTKAEAIRLIEAALTSQNRQLKYIVCLLMITGARPGELLRAHWSQVDLANAIWRIPVSGAGGKPREMRLTQAALNLLSALPRWDGCPHLIANPATRKPYRSVAKGWEAARAKAQLPYLELEDLRYSHLDALFESPDLLRLLREQSRRTREISTENVPPLVEVEETWRVGNLPAWFAPQPETASAAASKNVPSWKV
jgi:integrase